MGSMNDQNFSNKYNLIKYLIYLLTRVIELGHERNFLVNWNNQKLIISALTNFYVILLCLKK